MKSINIFKTLLLNTFFILFCLTTKAQPIPLELFVGEGSFLQTTMSVSRPFSKDSKFRVLSISSFEAHRENQQNNSSVMITDVNYSILKGLSGGIGLTYNSISGLSPTAGFGYNKNGKRYSIVVAPAVIFSGNTSIRLIANLIYKPQLTDNLNLYLASSNLLTYGFGGDHVRSYQKLRVGLDYKTFQFGVGVNFDQFGVNKISDRRLGGFVRKEF